MCYTGTSNVVVSDTDIDAVAFDAQLDDVQLRRLLEKLGVDKRNIEAVTGGGENYKEKAKAALNTWKLAKGHNATRQVILDKLQECRYNNNSDILKNMWGGV